MNTEDIIYELQKMQPWYHKYQGAIKEAISRLQAADNPCERCEEREKAFDALVKNVALYRSNRLLPSGAVADQLMEVVERLDPRRKAEPKPHEFNSRDWVWG